MIKLRKYSLAGTFFVCLFAATALQAKQNVQFLGIAFVGGLKDAKVTMPYVTKVLNESIRSNANTELLKIVSNVDREDLVFLTGGEGGGSVNSGSALATAVAISAESFRDNRTSSGNTLKLSLRAQILTFDFTNKRVISAFPVYSAAVRSYDDTTDMEALREQLVLETLIKNDEDPGKSIFDLVGKKLQSLTFKEGWNINLKVRDVTVNPTAEAILKINNIPVDAYKNWLAASFASSLSDFHDIPVLPYTQGEAVSKMRLLFDERNDVSFSLPPADFVVNLVARGFVTKELDSTPKTTTKTHIVGMEVHFSDVAFKKRLYAENMQMGRVVRYSKDSQVAEWPLYEEVQLVLITEFMAQLVKPDKKWVSRHIKSKSKFREIAKKMQTVNIKIIQEIKGK
ncbi:hypothetical protein N9K35_05815 [Pseudomonadales bacterium]|nr:hypothetical protein [Pseudomonadales bacterium]MDA9298246.1 hypothetical protein [Pseudomonadales bacterium]